MKIKVQEKYIVTDDAFFYEDDSKSDSLIRWINRTFDGRYEGVRIEGEVYIRNTYEIGMGLRRNDIAVYQGDIVVSNSDVYPTVYTKNQFFNKYKIVEQ